ARIELDCGPVLEPFERRRLVAKVPHVDAVQPAQQREILVGVIELLVVRDQRDLVRRIVADAREAREEPGALHGEHRHGGMHRDEDARAMRSEVHTSELQSLRHLVCRLLLEKKKKTKYKI